MEVLSVIKSIPALKKIPTVILSSSKAEEDIAKSYDLHANSYITKPINFTEFQNVLASIEHFWFKIVVYPENDTPHLDSDL